MKSKILITSILSILLTAACKKDTKEGNHKPETDTEAPLITFLAPDTATHYLSGSTMPISVKVEDNDEIHEIHLNVVNTSRNDSVMLHVHQHSHGQVAMLDTSFFIPDLGMHQDYELRVTASDHNSNESEKTLHKHIHM
ncbi:MAG: hypothetical protein CMI36_08820 [Owenweeksia sp.]|nr:hypothetical protein [Owenweeksia sp.]MBF99083.1 hypothetical protein [Owenweeksia sp.]HBF21591.1 hypothetical protein [Cryomorphaceae bacterium]|tara:strand:- start:558 stop:974 length:417 start_codon:yes stop_codon:yes gene_type:complete